MNNQPIADNMLEFIENKQLEEIEASMNEEPTYTKQQLVDALVHEYDYLCHDDFDPEEDMTIGEYQEYLNTLSVEQLIIETDTDDEYYTLDQYMYNHN